MHRKLAQVNQHQQCIIADQKLDLTKCQQELLSVKSSLKLHQEDKKDPDKIVNNTSDLQAIKLKENEQLQVQLEKELEATREQKKFLMATLSESNRQLSSIQRKYENSNELNCSLQIQLDEMIKAKEKNYEKMNDIEGTINGLNRQLEEERREKKDMAGKLHESTMTYEIKISKLQESCENLKLDNQNLKSESQNMTQTIETMKKKIETIEHRNVSNSDKNLNDADLSRDVQISDKYCRGRNKNNEEKLAYSQPPVKCQVTKDDFQTFFSQPSRFDERKYSSDGKIEFPKRFIGKEE